MRGYGILPVSRDLKNLAATPLGPPPSIDRMADDESVICNYWSRLEKKNICTYYVDVPLYPHEEFYLLQYLLKKCYFPKAKIEILSIFGMQSL